MCHNDGRGRGPEPETRRDIAVGDHSKMPAWHAVPHVVAGPPEFSRRPVLVVPDIYGPSPFYWHLAHELARAGHPATLVDHHFREGSLTEHTREAAFARRAAMDEVRAVDDLSHAVDSIKRDAGGAGTADEAVAGAVDDAVTVAVIGFCLGGQLALDLAATRQDLVTVGFYPFPEGVGGRVRVPAPRPVDLAPDISGPVLCFWGEEDYIPQEVIARFADAMADAGAPYQAHVYPSAGHSFMQGLVEDRPDSPAAHDAWRRTLAFLNHPRHQPSAD